MGLKYMPLVTIGIPFYNPGPAFIDAVRSVFAQSYPNWELLLVDDGSTDGSVDLAKRIKDPRVRVFVDGKHQGLVARLNQITDLASGSYIARMDADDLMHPERIEKQVMFLEQHPEVDVVDTGAIILTRDGYPVGVRGLENRIPSAFEILKWGGFLHPSVMGRRKWFKENPYDPRYIRAEDRELWARTYGRTRFAHIPEALYMYRFVGNVRLKPYLESYRSERKIILRYGPAMIGISQSLYLYLRSLAKSVILMALSLFRMEQIITKRKYNYIPPQLLSESIKKLQHIQRQDVPGWEIIRPG